MAFPRRPSAALRYLLVAILLAVTFYALLGPTNLAPNDGLVIARPWGGYEAEQVFVHRGDYHQHQPKHPIDDLIKTAEQEFADKLAKETYTLSDAAAAYRRRRGRHPPPGFEEWHAFAQEKNAVVVEEFWDQIYHDLEPFWAIKPAVIRAGANKLDMHIEIRDGEATTGSDWFWTQIWLDMIKTIEHMLPDMVLALNAMDEPRLVVPWEDIDRYMKEASKKRKIVDVADVVTRFPRLPKPGETPSDDEAEMPETVWERDKHYWKIVRRGCPPTSDARVAPIITNFNRTPDITGPFALDHMRNGYVSNYTLSTTFCHQADLQALEGIFVEPLSVSATKSLLPLFGGSKLAVNNDILLPAPMYWSEEERFTGAEGAATPWFAKYTAAIWRGVATGGLNRPDNWRSFQRHRFVAMHNTTQLASPETKLNFIPPDKRYDLPPPDDLARWTSETTSVAFTNMMCAFKDTEPWCNYTSPYFETAPGMPMAEQFAFKFLPDIDGNSFSGRYLGFLRSTSLPIKATLWREWHDSRLVAWKHFVPMDSRFGDWFGLLEYFVGNGDTKPARDHVAERIATAGKQWAARVLRKEDMQVYVLRLLLEYARVASDDREVLGWVGDLK
ncbi:uncharacterized protein C8A04DRAFT_34855 [Dichotomopilus funicola]|uniref:Glycosyl transferase CAP10 domain-containing protein n=1 Tax=Dichotomopilus funicola TaxID=1934379 RepID=A0AAN6ZQK9_9PEZI|nr:hypothetical protein C8A04DRAFT_34855 [Dichotomopilus funicola]